MATKNFTQFNTATPLTTSDYIVGYKADGSAEIKTQVQSIVNLTITQNKDIEVTDYTKGIILRDLNGVRRRIRLNTDGSLLTEIV